MKFKLFFLILGVWVVAACTQPAVHSAIPVVSPESVGLNPEHLALVDGVIAETIRSGNIPGAVLAVVRHDRIAYLKAYGNRQRIPPFRSFPRNLLD